MVLARPEAREACGVFGIYGPGEDVSRLTYFGLFALQHRGQESAGIATADGHDLHEHNGMGLVSRVFSEDDLEAMPGFISVGHCRYSTTGSSSEANIQPIMRRPAGPAARMVPTRALSHQGPRRRGYNEGTCPSRFQAGSFPPRPRPFARCVTGLSVCSGWAQPGLSVIPRAVTRCARQVWGWCEQRSGCGGSRAALSAEPGPDAAGFHQGTTE